MIAAIRVYDGDRVLVEHRVGCHHQDYDNFWDDIQGSYIIDPDADRMITVFGHEFAPCAVTSITIQIVGHDTYGDREFVMPITDGFFPIDMLDPTQDLRINLNDDVLLNMWLR